MAKKEKSNPLLDDLDLELESDLLESDDLEMTMVASPLPAKGVAVMDFSEFEDGIKEITMEGESVMKALIYGPNGTGKNTISATFPGPRLLLDVNEKGTKSMVGSEGSFKRSIDKFEMFIMAYWYLKSGNHPYKTVIIDNITTLQEMALRYVMAKDSDVDLSKDMDMPNKRDWGGLSQVMKRWLIEYRNLDMNVVFLAQEKRSNDEDLESDEASVFPQISPSVKAILGAAVDVIGRTFVIENEEQETGKTVTRFCMRIMPNPTYLAKIRLPMGAVSPAVIANPSYAALTKIMNGNHKTGGKK